MGRKSQATLEFLLTYGWAILLVLFMVALLAFFGLFEKKSEIEVETINDYGKIDIVVDSEPELQDICNKLMVNNEVYPFLEVMGNGLRKANGAEFIAYKFPAELRSDLEIFNVDSLILCGVPAELCYTENNDIKGGTYCILMVLEVPVKYQEFAEWYQKVSGGLNAKNCFKA